MNGIGDFFVKLFLNSIGLVFSILTLVYSISAKQEWAAWLATVSLLSGILLVILSVQEIRIILNVVFSQARSVVSSDSSSGQKIVLGARNFAMNSSMDFQEVELEAGLLVKDADQPEILYKNTSFALESAELVSSSLKSLHESNRDDLINLKSIDSLYSIDDSKPAESENTKMQYKKIKTESYQFFEVVKKNKAEHAFGQLEIIDDIYKRMKPYLCGERGLIISASTQSRGPLAVTLKQILNGDKSLDQLIYKNIYNDLDLLPDTEVNFITDRKTVENTLVALWSDYYRIVILVEEWEEEFWRAIGRNVNDRVPIGQNQDWLTVPAIKRKRPISYQNLSRFDNFRSRNAD